MRLNTLSLCKSEKIGTDELLNSTKKLVIFSHSEGRFSSWSREDLEIEGREVTKNTRKLITVASLEECEKAEKVLYNGLLYSIKSVKGDEQTRWRLLHIDNHGNDPNEFLE